MPNREKMAIYEQKHVHHDAADDSNDITAASTSSGGGDAAITTTTTTTTTAAAAAAAVAVAVAAARSFPRFAELPPELRAQIWWEAAVPGPGINFFNVHAFPGDHAGANRSSSPLWLYLDLRRLDVGDADADVAAYDPSVWRARAAVRQACREARDACAPPDGGGGGGGRIAVTLTRPRRGLLVRAADGLLRQLTPETAEEAAEAEAEAAVIAGGGGSRSGTVDVDVDINISDPPRVLCREPMVTRTVYVHADDVFCLSVENCSFNMPFEETSSPPAATFRPGSAGKLARVPWRGDFETGWSYDPQLTPLPAGIPRGRYCVNLARGDLDAQDAAGRVVPGMLSEVEVEGGGGEEDEDEDGDEVEDGYGNGNGNEEEAQPGDSRLSFALEFAPQPPPQPPHSAPRPTPVSPPPPDARRASHMRRRRELLMIDSEKVDSVPAPPLAEPTPFPDEVYHDRFGDAYVVLPSRLGNPGLPPYQLTKVAPEKSDMRQRYLLSARVPDGPRPWR